MFMVNINICWNKTSDSSCLNDHVTLKLTRYFIMNVILNHVLNLLNLGTCIWYLFTHHLPPALYCQLLTWINYCYCQKMQIKSMFVNKCENSQKSRSTKLLFHKNHNQQNFWHTCNMNVWDSVKLHLYFEWVNRLINMCLTSRLIKWIEWWRTLFPEFVFKN